MMNIVIDRVDEGSTESTLPDTWIWTTLGAVSDTSKQRVQPQDFAHMQYVGLDSIAPNTTELTGTASAGELRSQADRFRPGDVLYGRLRPYLNKVYCADFEGLCSSEFIVFRKKPEIESKYLQYFLHSWEFVQYASHVTEGDRPRISFDQMADYPFPLAPLAEQKRIVDVIEAQFTRLDTAVAGLQRLRANLQRYRQSVLKAACEGRLVPTEAELARAEDRPFEDGATLLQRILAERRRQWEADNRPEQPKNDKWKDKYREPAAPDVSSLPDLPDGWVWTRAEQICDWITKGTTPKASKLFNQADETTPVPFIKVYNLRFDGKLDFTVNPTFISRETHTKELARSIVCPGDVLMNIVGPPLGKVSIVPSTYSEWNMNQAIARYRPMPGVNAVFLSYLLRSEPILKWAIGRAKATAGQFNLTLEISRDLPLPLPPLAEQARIVEEVERRLSVIEQHEQVIAASLKRAERLRQSILKRAFAGQLVAQDPNDEPAWVLLGGVKNGESK